MRLIEGARPWAGARHAVYARLLRLALTHRPDRAACPQAEFQPAVGDLPTGGRLEPRTWLVLSDRHQHIDKLMQQAGARPWRCPKLGTHAAVGAPSLACAAAACY